MKFIQTWKKVTFEPKEFFKRMSKRTNYREPSIFYLKLYSIVLGVIALLLILFGTIILAFLGLTGTSDIAGLSIGIIAISIIFGFPLILLFSWGMLFVGAGITHIFVRLFGGKSSYNETFKVVSYSSAPYIFSFIPLVNYAAMVYIIILQVMGISQRHKISLGRAAAAVLLPVFVTLMIIGFVYVLTIIPAMNGVL